MGLEQKINEELKLAIKSGDKTRIDALRSIRALIIEFNKSGVGREMNDEDEIKLLNSLVKKRKEAIELYEKGGREDLAAKERAELRIIQEFLPEQISEEEIKNVLKKIIEEVQAKDIKDIGKVMGSAMRELSGKADGKVVQQIARELLGQ